MSQAELFTRETPVVSAPAGDHRRTLDNRGQPARGGRQTLKARAALRRYIRERQRAYDATHSHAAWFRLRDAVTAALRAGV